MSIITIRGQSGSGAPEIGKQVAASLNIKYLDREIIAQVAKRLKLRKQEIAGKEMPPSTFWERIAEVLTNTYPVHPGIPDVGLPVWDIPLNDASYLAGLEFVIKELAKNQPIVIRGRGSQFILKDYPDSFHILTVAPLEMRVGRVMQDLGTDEESAKREINRVDSSRREFIKRYFKADLEDPIHYDLVINTGHLNFDASTNLILNALKLQK